MTSASLDTTPRSASRGLNLTYLRTELRRMWRNPSAMFFSAILPAFFYIIFGAMQSYSDEPWGNSNAAMVTMITMAAYGAVVATVGIGAMVAIERLQGWGRQLALTPMSDRGYLVVKVATAVTISVIPVTLIYIIGQFTGAEGPLRAWILSALIVIAGGVVFACYGLAFGLAMRSDAAMGAAAGSLTIWAFAGNMFVPLSGTILTIGKFTPLFGYSELARYPASEGELIGDMGPGVHLPLWQPVTNLAVWTIIMVVLTGWLLGRSRARL